MVVRDSREGRREIKYCGWRWLLYLQQPDEFVHADTDAAKNSAKGAAVELVMKRYGHRFASGATQSDVAAPNASHIIAEVSQRRNATLAGYDR